MRCSVSRNDQIEAILTAWYEFENCALSEKAKWRDERITLSELLAEKNT
jgi:hypothetical protein